MESIKKPEVEQIMGRYVKVQQNIELALQRTSRPSGSVRLLVVTKRQPDELVLEIARAGILLLGENYPEEGARKRELLEPEGYIAEWHLIGSLQRRKAKIAVKNYSILHSIDRLSIAEEVNHSAKQLGKQMRVLLQFNMSGEGSKSGWLANTEENWFQLLPVVKTICSFKHLNVIGLMTMPPLSEEPENSRPYYKKLSDLRSFFVQEIAGVEFLELSIGTSFDYEVAVEEGATIVRVGEAILGPRKQNLER